MSIGGDTVYDNAGHDGTGGDDTGSDDTGGGDTGHNRWSADRAFALFEARTNLEKGGTPHLRQYRLERMGEILRRLGNPHLALPTIHLAGSKGKGSTAAFTAHVLAAAGARTALYTSPHVTGYRERFRVLPARSADPAGSAGETPLQLEPLQLEPLLREESRQVWAVVEAMSAEGMSEDELPTTFELLTALAFRFFLAARCDAVVLETGLGGRLDATNLCQPIMTMITRIELEHQEYLGNTLEEIAREKGGIIKPGVPVVIAPQRRVVREVLTGIARERGAPLIPMRTLTTPDTERPFVLGMNGAVQRVNAGQALAALGALARTGALPGPERSSLPVRAVIEGLAAARLPGRGERLEDLILDGAHTPESVAQVARALHGNGRIAILGVVGGKDLAGIVSALRGRVARIIVSRPGTFKPGDPSAVYDAVLAAGIPAELHLDATAALARARELNAELHGKLTGEHKRKRRRETPPPILVTGSFYMVGEIRRLVGGDRCP